MIPNANLACTYYNDDRRIHLGITLTVEISKVLRGCSKRSDGILVTIYVNF